MAQLMAAFDARTVDPTQGAGSLPVGKHPVVITASEIKPTSDNSGGMLVLDLQIIDGPNKGTTGNYRLNLYNKSAKACEIAHKQMSAVCHVTGIYNVTDSSQLHNIPFVIEVALQSGEEAAAKGYTEVKRVYDMQGNEPGKQGQPPAAPQPQAQQFAPPAQQQAAAPAPAAAWGTPTQQQAAAPAPAPAAAWGNQAGQQQAAAPAGGAPWGR